MNRLQKKCLVAAAGTHFLVVVVVMCSGFIASKPNVETPEILTLVDPKTTDNASSGSTQPPPPAPAVKQPDVTPPPPAAAPPKPDVKPPEPPKPVVKPPEPKEPDDPTPDPAAIKPKPKPKPKPHEVEPSLTPVVRKNTADLEKKKAEEEKEEAEQRAIDKANKRAHDLRVKAFKDAATFIKNNASSPTSVELPAGANSASYANYASVVLSVYTAAWSLPNDTANDDSIVKVSVTIANNGRVLNAHIVSRSGDHSMDASVQRALDRVTEIAPFPDGSTDRERTYIINFNLKALRQMFG